MNKFVHVNGIMAIEVNNNPRKRLINVFVCVANREKAHLDIVEHADLDQQRKIGDHLFVFILGSTILSRKSQLQTSRLLMLLYPRPMICAIGIKKNVMQRTAALFITSFLRMLRLELLTFTLCLATWFLMQANAGSSWPYVVLRTNPVTADIQQATHADAVLTKTVRYDTLQNLSAAREKLNLQLDAVVRAGDYIVFTNSELTCSGIVLSVDDDSIEVHAHDPSPQLQCFLPSWTKGSREKSQKLSLRLRSRYCAYKYIQY